MRHWESDYENFMQQLHLTIYGHAVSVGMCGLTGTYQGVTRHTVKCADLVLWNSMIVVLVNCQTVILNHNIIAVLKNKAVSTLHDKLSRYGIALHV